MAAKSPFSRAILVLAMASVFAACTSSGASTPAPAASGAVAPAASVASVAPAAHASPAGATAHASTAHAAAAPSAAAVQASDPVLAALPAKFAGLTSYQFDVTLSGGSYESALAPHGVQGTVVYAPSFAVEFNYVDSDIIAIDGMSWTKNGGIWDPSPYPDTPTLFASFGPPVLFAHDLTPFLNYYSTAGDEVVDNVSTTHYTCNPKALGYFSGLYGFKGDATVAADVWVAKSGGYPVQFEITASGSDSFDFKVVISKADDAANVVHVPAH